MTFRYGAAAIVLGLTLVVGACGDDGGTGPTDAEPVVAKQGGDTQTAAPGATLPDAIVVRVTREGTPLEGQNVAWDVALGGGSVTPTTSTTGANGEASTTWTLGATRTQSLEASVTGATGSPLTFFATVETPAPAAANVSVGDNFFDPSSARVAAGGMVTWTWAGAVAHNVTFASGANSATQTAGTFVRTFPSTGSFSYSCTIHGAAMSGTVVVE